MTVHRQRLAGGEIAMAPLKPMADAYLALMRQAGEFQIEMLRFVGERLQKDMAYSGKLLECKDPSEVLKAHLDFCNCFMDDYLKEGRRLGDVVGKAVQPEGNGAAKH
jgi:hypothetical protein